MTTDIQRTILFSFRNKFTKAHILTISTPYLPFLASNGYYSRMYKQMKESAAVGFQKSLVVGKHSFDKRRTKRTIIQLDSGVVLDFPYDANTTDMKIINHHLEGLKLSLTK